MSRPVIAFVGSATINYTLLAETLDDWLDSLDDPKDPLIILPASRVLATSSVLSVHEWAEISGHVIKAIAAPRTGIRCTDLLEYADKTAGVQRSANDGDVLHDLVEFLGDHESDQKFLVLLWEEGEEDELMEQIALKGAKIGADIKSLSSEGLDDIDLEEEDEEPIAHSPEDVDEQEDTKIKKPGRQAAVATPRVEITTIDAKDLTEVWKPEEVAEALAPTEADEGQATVRPIAESILNHGDVGRAAADLAEYLFRYVDEIVRDRVALYASDAVFAVLGSREKPAEKPSEVSTKEEVSTKAQGSEKPVRGHSRLAGGFVMVMTRKDGTQEILPEGRRGRLPAGATKQQMLEAEAMKLGLL